jgi:hypothetical protein
MKKRIKEMKRERERRGAWKNTHTHINKYRNIIFEICNTHINKYRNIIFEICKIVSLSFSLSLSLITTIPLVTKLLFNRKSIKLLLLYIFANLLLLLLLLLILLFQLLMLLFSLLLLLLQPISIV